MTLADGRTSLGFALLAALFTGALVIAAVLAAKIIAIGPLFVPAGVLAYSVTFACTDIVAEVYGGQAARRVVLAGFVTLLAVLLLIQIALVWPPAPFWQGQEGFKGVLATSARVIVASAVAYLVSQYTDIYVFGRLRQATGGRYLWLRNNASTMISQLIDSSIFITIAFLGTFPVLPLIFGQWVVKLAVAALDTPFVYLGTYILRRHDAGGGLAGAYGSD